MGIFDFLKPSKVFITEVDFQKNLKNQVKMVPETLEQLYQIGVKKEDNLRLEYFFYSKLEKNAGQILAELEKLNYSGEYWKGEKLYVITGWTEKIEMSTEVVKNWVTEMCQIGFKYDCEFDGWGTSPE